MPIAAAPGRLSNRDDRKLLGTDKEKVCCYFNPVPISFLYENIFRFFFLQSMMSILNSVKNALNMAVLLTYSFFPTIITIWRRLVKSVVYPVEKFTSTIIFQ